MIGISMRDVRMPRGWDKPLEIATGEEVGIVISILIGAWVVVVAIVLIINLIIKRRMKDYGQK